MRWSLTKAININVPVVVLHKMPGGLFVAYESEYMVEDPTLSFSRAHPIRKDGGIFLLSSGSWTTRFLARTLATLMRTSLFVVQGGVSGSSTGTATKGDSSESSEPTA